MSLFRLIYLCVCSIHKTASLQAHPHVKTAAHPNEVSCWTVNKWSRLERKNLETREHQREQLSISDYEGLDRLQHFIITTPTCSYSEKKEKNPRTVSICFSVWRVSSEIKQVFDISFIDKRSHTLGRIRWGTSSSYIHCLSFSSVYINLGGFFTKIHTLNKFLFSVIQVFKASVSWQYRDIWAFEKKTNAF